nr:uncharacterized protein LOC120967205 [Aegilops tauschii subsp. strangulata]
MRIIKFYYVTMVDSSLDFSGCPALEKLAMEDCCIYKSIYSKSLEYLRFTGNCVFSQDDRIHIHAPRLISISLLCDGVLIDGGLTPLLGMMPLLKRAYVRLGYSSRDSSKRNRDNVCLLLDGLSNAVDLELSSMPEVLIYRWDLKWCPKFDKLKTLVLTLVEKRAFLPVGKAL